MDIQAKPFSTTCRLHLSDRLRCLSLLNSAGWLLLQLWGPAHFGGSSRAVIYKSSSLCEEAAGTLSKRLMTGRKQSEVEKWVGEGVRELVGLLKVPNKSKARSLCEIELIQTVGMVFPHHALPLCQWTIYGMKLGRCLSPGSTIAQFVSCFSGAMACGCALMELFYTPLLQIPSSGRRRTCGTG